MYILLSLLLAMFSFYPTPINAGLMKCDTLSDTGIDSAGLNINVNDNGKAMAVWSIDDGAASKIQAAYFDGTSWGTAVDISSFGEKTMLPWVHLNNANKAVAVWQSASVGGPTSSADIKSATSINGIWSPEVTIKSGALLQLRSNPTTSKTRLVFLKQSVIRLITTIKFS